MTQLVILSTLLYTSLCNLSWVFGFSRASAPMSLTIINFHHRMPLRSLLIGMPHIHLNIGSCKGEGRT